MIEDVKKGNLDLAFVTKKKDNSLHYVEWIEDELVVFSNKPLPTTMELEDLKNYKMICREENSSTREFIKKVFTKANMDCNKLNIVSIVHNSTALKNTILNANEQFVSIISKAVIKEEVKNKKLFITKIKGINLKRKTFIVYRHKTKEIEAILKFINS